MAASTIEYLLVSDKANKIIKSSLDYNEIVKMANLIRGAGGEVTIFRSLTGRTNKNKTPRKANLTEQEL